MALLAICFLSGNFAASASTSAPDYSTIYVPATVSTLQSAINLVNDRGTIVLAAGTYNSPSGGFRISDLHKRFTIRSAPGALVTLDGQNSREIIRVMNTDITQGGPVVFQDLIFANGYSNTPGIAGGVNLYHAEATFVNCTFKNNMAGPNTSGGGTLITLGSIVFFFDSTWQDNSAVYSGAGMVIQDHSKVYVHHSQFINNRTNLPNHSPWAAGAAIFLGNSLLRISNTRFENNQAGYAGGAITAIGFWVAPETTPQADVIISNSSFVNNSAFPAPGVSAPAPTEGGALHAEGQTDMKIFNSRFVGNSANAGGAITNYRANIQIDGSVFQGNRAVGQGNVGGYGGVISASSQDTPSDGTTNQRNVSLTIRNSLFQGQPANSNNVGYGGGGIAITGDTNRNYGANGVPQMGTPTENRAELILQNVIFNDLDVVNGSALGGGVLATMTDVNIQDSLFINSDAMGQTNGSGGGIAIIDNSLANISRTTFSHNSAGVYGGALFLLGSTINLDNSNFIENSVGSIDYGSAIFAGPMNSPTLKIPISGNIHNNKIIKNHGVAVYDDDYTNGPINNVVYNSNTFYTNPVDSVVYSDAILPYQKKKVSELNSLTIVRANGTSTKKSNLNNISLSSPPSIAVLISAPSTILNATAAGDVELSTAAYIGYAWSGSSGTLDGAPLSDIANVRKITQPGNRLLSVGAIQSSITIAPLFAPSLSLTAQLTNTGAILSWSLTASSLLDLQMDQGVHIPAIPTGSVLAPAINTTYRIYAITQEGGAFSSAASSSVQIFLPTIFR